MCALCVYVCVCVCLNDPQDPRRRPSVDSLLARPSVLRRREELSSVLDGTLKAAIADDELDMLATIQVRWLGGMNERLLRTTRPSPALSATLCVRVCVRV
jgi:hypothetical protein